MNWNVRNLSNKIDSIDNIDFDKYEDEDAKSQVKNIGNQETENIQNTDNRAVANSPTIIQPTNSSQVTVTKETPIRIHFKSPQQQIQH